MADHAEKSEKKTVDDNATKAMPQAPAVRSQDAGDGEPKKSKPSIDWRSVKDQTVGLLAGIVRWIGLIFALVLVLHIIFTIAEANPDNGIVQFVSGWADPLTLGFQDLFTPDDPNLQTLVNYGIAAIFWLVVSALGAKIIRRIGGAA
jgi:hypothetical protein